MKVLPIVRSDRVSWQMAGTDDQISDPSQYFASRSDTWLLAIRNTLGEFVESEAEADPELYDNMLRDGEVESAISTRIDAVISEGFTVVPSAPMPANEHAADPEELTRAKRAQEVAEFVTDALGPNIIASMGQAVEAALKYGHSIMEIVLKLDSSKRLVVHELVDLERRARFVVEGAQVIGVNLKTGTIGASQVREVFIPRAKLLVHSHRPRGRDPRGRSALWAAYTAWYSKTAVWPEFLRHLKQFGSPSFVGKTRNKEENPSGMVEVVGPDGTLEKSDLGEIKLVAEGYNLFKSLQKFRNGSVIVVPGGSEVVGLWPQGDGAAFREGLAYFDRSIHRAINGTARMSYEAEHSSGADSKEAIDVFKLRVGRNQEDLGRTYTQLARLLVELNFPPSDREFCPAIHVGGSSQATWEERADGIAKLTSSGYLDESQLPELDAELGLPVRDAEAAMQRKQEREFAQSVTEAEVDKVVNP